MVYVPATKLKVLRTFMCRGETVPAGAYLGPAQIKHVQRKLHVLLSNGTLLAVPDTYERQAQEDPQPTYLNPKAVTAVSAGALTASFTATPTALSVVFDGSASSVTAPKTVTDWEWDFGDGTALTTEQDANVTHVYAAPGAYVAKLVVIDSSDRRSFADSEALALEGVFTPAFTHTETLLSVAFNASTSTATGDIVGYEWDWDEGDPVELVAVATKTHVFDAAGTYTVSLVLIDEWDERSDPVTHEVTVAAA